MYQCNNKKNPFCPVARIDYLNHHLHFDPTIGDIDSSLMNKTLAYPLTKISQICIGTAYRRSHRTIRNAIKNQLVRAQGSIKPAHNHRNARPQTPQKVRSRTRHERQGIPTKSLLQRREARIAQEAGQRDPNGRGPRTSPGKNPPKTPNGAPRG